MTIDVNKIHLRDANNDWASLPDWTYQIQGQPFSIGQLLTNAAGGSNFYGVCSTGAGTAAKTATVNNIGTNVALTANDLKKGLAVTIRFQNTNTATNPTLNINSLGAKPIYRYGTTPVGKTIEVSWLANTVISLIYDTDLKSTGCWILNDINTNTSWYGTCETVASTTAKVVTCNNFYLTSGAKISIQCTTANTVAAPTINVNSTGAKSIYINNAVTSADNPFLWDEGAVLELVYDGTNYRVASAPVSTSELTTLLNSF